MKLTLLFIFLFVFNSNSQLKYFVEYNASINKGFDRIRPITDLIFSNSLTFNVKNEKFIYSLGLGREDWNFDFFRRRIDNPSLFSYYCNTYKVIPQIEREFSIPKTKISINIGVGLKIYFKNQLKDSLTKGFGNILQIKPSTLMKLNPSSFSNKLDGVIFGSLEDYNYITNIPYAIKCNLAFQYNFKTWGIKMYLEPYIMNLRYQNAKNVLNQGSSFIFFLDLGIGINHAIVFKKKVNQPTL